MGKRSHISAGRSSRLRAFWRVAAVSSLVLALAGCESINFYSEQIDENSKSAVDNAAFRPSSNPVVVDNVRRNDRLARLAEAQHPKILATYGGVYSDQRLERMIAKVVGSLTTVNGNTSQAYNITILNSPQVNAFALPGGNLYVTRGLLALATDSAELAAVIAHEMGHVTSNHGIVRQQLEQEAQIATRVARDLLSNPEAKTTELRSKLALAQFSRNQELEADAVGIRSSGQAGYDPFAASRFLAAMQAYGNMRSVSGATDASLDFLASHPNNAQRIQLAQGHARQFGPEGTGTTDRDAYLSGIDGLLFGDTPEEGYVRGNTFMHPQLGVSFSAPQGFIIDNTAAAVTANGPGDTAVRFDGVENTRGLSLTDYLRSGWVTGLDPSTVRATTINGADAAVGKARADNWQFDITVIRDGNQIYRLLTAAPTSASNLDSVAGFVRNSFKLLSPAEKAALKPLRIRIVSARSGDTVASMAGRMVGVDRKADLFRVLNGLDAGQAVTPGTRYKIVTD